jgi:glycerol-3-phosphate acyltransferase PlsX
MGINNSKETWIALDAMGGDHAPGEIVRGAIIAASKGINVILVGNESRISQELGDTTGSRIKIHHTSQVIEMADQPARAIKAKPDNSLSKAFELVKEKKADAILSAGNSGAMLVASKWCLGDTPGIFRPAIAVPIPTPRGEIVMVDGGISTDCSPENLFQFAVMGHVYSKHVQKIESPRVGLLNIGEEKSKGNLTVQKAYEFLQSSKLNFVGNIEGDKLFLGEVDVVVCDGFIGNIILKVSEGVAREFLNILKKSLNDGGIMSKVGMLLMKNSFRSMKKKLDWAEYGGALIMGVEGNVIITHGKANATSIANALSFADKVAKADLSRILSSELTLNINKSPSIAGL